MKIYILSVLFLCIAIFDCPAGILNYDNNPDLTEAFRYCAENNYGYSEDVPGTDIKGADRAKAEFYYLKYLETEKHSFQRARVYTQIGVLYTTAFNEKKGEKCDLVKAKEYFEKALECEPQRIDSTMIRTRFMLSSVATKPCTLDRVKSKMVLYNFLLTLDSAYLLNNFLPETPSEQEYFDYVKANGSPSDEKGKFAGYSESIKRKITIILEEMPSDVDMIIHNVTDDAIYSDAPIEGLNYIMQQLPDSAVTHKKYVQEAINKLANPVVEEQLQTMLNEFAPQSQSGKAVMADITVRRRFIPEAQLAEKDGSPFLFDLASGVNIEMSLTGKYSDEGFDEKSATLAKGDMLWTGKLVTCRGAMLVPIKQESARPYKHTKDKYISSYEIELKNLPYTVLIKNADSMYFLIKIINADENGITVLYNQIPKEKASELMTEDSTIK
ncbi:MAG: hypothetical protein JW745_01605 [Sedimentisphaerales bacterium]|nr:hypothetical protein [Sedimentisphaerales bacterium]